MDRTDAFSYKLCLICIVDRVAGTGLGLFCLKVSTLKMQIRKSFMYYCVLSVCIFQFVFPTC